MLALAFHSPAHLALIGVLSAQPGALAAWGETRSTLDVDLVVNLPVEQMPQLSLEPGRRGMLVPAELMLDLWMEERGGVALVA